jgi:hypothetical protein
VRTTGTPGPSFSPSTSSGVGVLHSRSSKERFSRRPIGPATSARPPTAMPEVLDAGWTAQPGRGVRRMIGSSRSVFCWYFANRGAAAVICRHDSSRSVPWSCSATTGTLRPGVSIWTWSGCAAMLYQAGFLAPRSQRPRSASCLPCPETGRPESCVRHHSCGRWSSGPGHPSPSSCPYGGSDSSPACPPPEDRAACPGLPTTAGSSGCIEAHGPSRVLPPASVRGRIPSNISSVLASLAPCADKCPRRSVPLVSQFIAARCGAPSYRLSCRLRVRPLG